MNSQPSWRSAIGVAAAFTALAGTSAFAQPGPSAPAPLTPFYASCLASGGAPGVLTAAGTDLRTVFFSTQARLVSLTLSPAPNGSVQVTRKVGNSTPPPATLGAGQSAVFEASELSIRHDFQPMEYCLRAY